MLSGDRGVGGLFLYLIFNTQLWVSKSKYHILQWTNEEIKSRRNWDFPWLSVSLNYGQSFKGHMEINKIKIRTQVPKSLI